jgi:hypothetical protein
VCGPGRDWGCMAGGKTVAGLGWGGCDTTEPARRRRVRGRVLQIELIVLAPGAAERESSISSEACTLGR